VNASAAAKEEDEVGGLGGGCFVGSMPHGGFLRSPRIRQINGGHPSPAARRKPGCNAGKGKREYPLPDRHLGQHAIDEMRRGVHHPAAAAGRADRSSLVRKCRDPVLPAGVTMHAQGAVCQNLAPRNERNLRSRRCCPGIGCYDRNAAILCAAISAPPPFSDKGGSGQFHRRSRAGHSSPR